MQIQAADQRARRSSAGCLHGPSPHRPVLFLLFSFLSHGLIFHLAGIGRVDEGWSSPWWMFSTGPNNRCGAGGAPAPVRWAVGRRCSSTGRGPRRSDAGSSGKTSLPSLWESSPRAAAGGRGGGCPAPLPIHQYRNPTTRQPGRDGTGSLRRQGALCGNSGPCISLASHDLAGSMAGCCYGNPRPNLRPQHPGSRAVVQYDMMDDGS